MEISLQKPPSVEDCGGVSAALFGRLLGNVVQNGQRVVGGRLSFTHIIVIGCPRLGFTQLLLQLDKGFGKETLHGRHLVLVGNVIEDGDGATGAAVVIQLLDSYSRCSIVM